MKNLTSYLFCIFVLIFFNSCEPEELPQDKRTKEEYLPNQDFIGDTGDQKNEIDDNMDE